MSNSASTPQIPLGLSLGLWDRMWNWFEAVEIWRQKCFQSGFSANREFARATRKRRVVRAV